MQRRRHLQLFVGASLLAVSAIPGGQNSLDAAGGQIAYLAKSSELAPPDQVLADHLTGLGFSLTAVDDDDAGALDTSTFDLIVIGTDVAAWKIGTTFRDTPVPLITWEHLLYDDLGLTTNADKGRTPPTATLTVTEPAHPIAAGLGGELTVTSTNQRQAWGRPSADATIVARETRSPNRPVIFSYETGDQMAGVQAPARRVGFFLDLATASSWTDDAMRLFEGAVSWAMGSTSPPQNRAPSVNAGPDTTLAVGDLSILLQGSVTDDGLPGGAVATTWTGEPGVSFDDASSATTTATFTTHGAYELTLAADDGDLQASDTVTIVVPDPDAPPPDDVTVAWITSAVPAPYGETPGIERLESAGYEVIVHDDQATSSIDVAGASLVVITSTVRPGHVDPAIAQLDIPMLIWEPNLYDDFGLVASSTDAGQTSTSRSIEIVDPTNPLAGGLTGSVIALDQAKPLSWGRPLPTAFVVATTTDDPERAVIWGYDMGDSMGAWDAPARRLAFMLSYSGPRRLSADGWELWDAAIAWLLETPAPRPSSPVAAFDADPATGEAPLTVAFDASGSSDPDDDIASYAWDLGDGTTADGPTATHTYADPGAYTVVLTVTDATERSTTASATIQANAPWYSPAHHFRTQITVEPAAHDRTGVPVVVDFDATALFAQLGAPQATFDPATIRVVEVDDHHDVVDADPTFQFDRAAQFEPTTSATGELVVIPSGTTAAGDTRRFDVYFDTAGQDIPSVSPPPRVVTSLGTSDEGLSTVTIATDVGDWWYDLDGGGFSSLDDVEGNDWISHNAAPGAGGAFRGIPNSVHPAGLFHPGNDGVTSEVIASGPARTTIESVGGGYAARWHVYPSFAEMAMMQASGDFWFLYEGTPGGSLDLTTDLVVLPDGSSIPASGSFTGDLDGEEWVFFSDEATGRSLFVAHLDDDSISDSYRDLAGEMTVFGFGRADSADPLLSEVPARFRVGLIETIDAATGAAAVRAATAPTSASVGAIETSVPGMVPPTAVASATPRAGDPPLAVQFDASASTAGGTIAAYSWDFGDGSPSAPGETVSHVYETSGTYVAVLTVTDDAGLTDTDAVIVNVGLAQLERSTEGVLALYDFTDITGDTVADRSGVVPAVDLTIADTAATTTLAPGGLAIDQPTSVSSPATPAKITDAISLTDEFTVEAWVRTSDLAQNGPARIVTISESPQSRNLTVGQGVFSQTGDRLEVRVRTSVSDDNGKPALDTPAGSLTTDLTHVVVSRDQGGEMTIYLNGQSVASRLAAGALDNWDAAAPLTLGNEADGSRPWLGEFHLLAIFDRAFSADDVCTHLGAGPPHGTGPGNMAPTACLRTSATTVEAPAAVTFDASLSRDLDGAITEYRWDFGDQTNATTTAPIVTHQYDEQGDFTASLTTVDDLGATGTTTVDIEVLAPTGGNRIRWSHLASPDPRLPAPPFGAGEEQQTASLVADLDGDGDNDFVLAGRRPPEAGIVWYEFVDLATGWVPHVLQSEVLRVEAGGDVHDVDGDGDVDIVFGRDGTGPEIWWWENPSDSTDPRTIEWNRHLVKAGGADKHHDLQFGDVDADGVAELVYWNQRADNALVVSEIPADPTAGTWSATTVFTNGDVDSEGLAISDIDLDGDDDIVGAGRWFEHQPDGTFLSHEIDPDYSFSRTAVGQLVAGGRPEVVIDSGDGIGPLTWYRWDDATETWVGTDLVGVSTYGHSLRLGDIDGDGNTDILSAEMVSPFDTSDLENPNAVTRVFFGDGVGGFELQNVAIGADHHESRLADLDADGDLDILGKRYNIGVPGLDIWLNDGIDPFGRWDRTVLDDPAPWTPLFVHHADLDGDGWDDVVTGGWWYRNPGSAGGDWERSVIGDPLANVVVVDDLDGDGDVDVVGSHWRSRLDGVNGEFSWGRNDGDGTFTVFAMGDTGDGPFPQGAVLAVLQTGGPTELVLSWNNGGAGTRTIAVPDDLASNPDQAPWPMRTLTAWSEGEEVVASDLDGDGDTDLLLGSTWLRNDDPTWSTVTIFALRTGLPDRIVLADVDGDGDDDAVIGNGDAAVGRGYDPAGELSWYERPDDPAATWEHHLIANLANPQSVGVADLDGDGDPDVVVGEHDVDLPDRSRLLVYENLGQGTDWQATVVHTGDEHHDGALLFDADLDGDVDIASIGFLQQRVVVYRNQWL